MTLTRIASTGVEDSLRWVLGANGTSDYTFTGPGLTGTVNDPTIYLTRGHTYIFQNNSGGHPFYIKTSTANGGTNDAYNTGVTNNGGGNGTEIVFTVPHDSPDILYYQCSSHASMAGQFNIAGSVADGSISTAKIADGAVTSAKIANSSITSADFSADCVGTAALANNAVTTAKITDANVTTAKIADEAVTLAKLSHGTSSNDGKFLRANNGADPTFETITGTTINNNADNRVITGSGTANTLNGESSLTFDGTQLNTTSTLFGSGNVSKTQDGVIIQRNSSTGSAEIVAGRSGGNYSGIETYVAGASGVTKRYDNLYSGEHRWYAADGTTELVRLDNTGKVGIGKNNPAFLLEIKGATTDTVRLNHSGETGSGSHDVKIVAGGAHYQNIHFEGSNIFYKTWNGSSVGERFRIRSTGGVTFNGDTADANALDDYEEGTWTPTFAGQLNPQSYSQQVGHYTKIGNFVIATCQLKLAGDPGSYASNVHIDGLPFAGKTGGVGGAAVLAYQTNFNSATDGRGNFTGMVNPNQATIRFYTPDGTYYLWSEVNDRDEQIRVTATYRTN